MRIAAKIILVINILILCYSLFLTYAWVCDHVNPGLGEMVDIKRTLISVSITTAVLILIVLYLVLSKKKKHE